MIQGYTASKTRGKNLWKIFTALICWWAFVQPIFAAPPTHKVFITVQSGDTLYSLFKKQHISPQTLATLLRLPNAGPTLKKLHLQQKIRFSFDQKNNLESLALSLSSSKTLFIYRAGSRFIARVENGSFSVPAASKKAPVKPVTKTPKTPIIQKTTPKKIIKIIPNAKSTLAQNKKIEKNTKAPILIKKKTPPAASKKITAPAKKTTKQTAPVYPPLYYAGMIIHTSFYGDAKKHHIPNKIIDQLISIFSLQINFKKTHAGDLLLLAYDDRETIVAAQFTQGPRTYTATRYVNAQGVVEYFSPDGQSMKKAFNRFPVKYTHINSLFNMHRMHPVTHVYRPHTGVDLAAPLGTPIYSTGDGKVTFIGWEGAYGNIIKIQHDEKYSTMYAHLLRFAPALSSGMTVKRGQLIGYLGQTGNATGPHVHFEVRIHNVPVNPLTVPLPHASSVPPSQINAFRAKAQSLIAALNHYQKTKL